MLSKKKLILAFLRVVRSSPLTLCAVALCSMMGASCVSVNPSSSDQASALLDKRNGQDPWKRKIYERLQDLPSAPSVQLAREVRRFDLSAQAMPISSLVRLLVDRAEISVVCASSLDDKAVTMELKKASADDVLSTLARRYGVKVVKVGGIYYLGDAAPEDKSVYVRKVLRLDPKAAIDAASTLMSHEGKVQCTEDGLLIVGDTVDCIVRVAEMFDKVESSPLDSWLCQVHVITLADADSHNIGLDLNPSLDLGARMSMASGATSPTWALDATAALKDIIHTAKSSTKSSVDAQPFFVCLDGFNAKQSSTDSIPIPTQTVSGAGSATGTSTSTSFQNADIGFKCDVLIHYLGNEKAVLTLNLDMRQVVGYVNNTAPISRGHTFETKASVQSGGVYLLGELANAASAATTANIGDTRHQAENSRSVTQIWVRVFRIAAPIEDKK